MKHLRLLLIPVFVVAAACGDDSPGSSPDAATSPDSLPAVRATASDSAAASSATKLAMDSLKPGRPDTAAKRYFRATGTEPFWSLSIDFTKTIIFKDVEGKELEVPVGKGERAMDANVIRYASQTAKGNLVVQIAKQECVNEMSGQKFDYTVTIDVQEAGNADVRTLKGCGRYLAVDSLASGH